MAEFIWIDTTSGTWGTFHDDYNPVVVVSVKEAARILGDDGDVVFGALDSMSDGDISEFGLDNGLAFEIPSSAYYVGP